MNGPAAPKDPEKKRPYFYILKDKEIFGAKQPDGSAIHFIYESDGRLINSAQIVGNIVYICPIIHGQRMIIFRDRSNLL